MPNTILGGGSRLNKLKKIEEALSRTSRTVYVELTGNDISGDGSESKPFASVERALSEQTGTTIILDVVLGNGVHDIKNFFEVSHGQVKIMGTGSLRLGTGVVVPCSSLISVSTSGVFWINVPVVEQAGAAITQLFALSGNGRVMIWSSTLTLNNVTGSLVGCSWGQNTFYIMGCSVTSVNAITKIGGITADLSVYEQTTSYTNIT